MLGGTGFKGRGAMSAIARQRLTALPRSSRSMSSFRLQRTSGGYGRFNQALAGGLTWRATSSFPGLMSARFNSTSSTASDASAPPASDALVDPATQMGTGNISDLSLDKIESIPEHIGYLKDLGLDFGWGPSALIEYVIEHLHMWAGLPWWASIVGTGLLVRAALVYPTLGAADTATKMQNVKHVVGPLRTKYAQQNAAGNMVEAAKTRAELSKVNSDHGIQTFKAFVPFIQIPLGFGCYRVVNAMTSLPVPALALESAGWLKDLTVADPLFVLPLMASSMMYFTLRKGGESGTNEMQNTNFGRAMTFGLPAISFAFMAFFPSALQLYFVATGMFAFVQANVVKSESFRRFANIAIPNKQLPVNPQDGPTTLKGLRLLRDKIQAEQAKMIEEQKQNPTQVPDVSFIDRMLDSLKDSKNNIQREATEKIDEIRGQAPAKNPDGTPAAPPRLGEKDLKLAADYERRRKEEDEWKREERNHARREAHMKTLEAQREKARASWEKNAKGR